MELPRPSSPDLNLKRLQDGDAPALFALVQDNRSYLREWLPWLDEVQAVADTLDFIQSTERQFLEGRGLHTGIWRGAKLLGVIGHNRLEPEQGWCSLGYWLAQSAQGQGTMTDCVAAYIEHAFSVLAMQRVEIRCAVGNLRSQQIPRRLGLQPGARLPEAENLYGRLVDHIVFGITADDWQNRRTTQAGPG